MVDEKKEWQQDFTEKSSKGNINHLKGIERKPHPIDSCLIESTESRLLHN